MRTLKRASALRPSPALVVACLALAVALGGTSYAAFRLPPNSVGTQQLKKNAVTSLKVKSNSLLGADIKESTLTKVPSARRADEASSATEALSLSDSSTGAAIGVSSTPTAGDLLPLSENGRFPASVIPTVDVVARVYRSTDQTVPTQIAGAPVMRVVFDRVSFDTAHSFDPAHPTRLTVPVTGIYLITAAVYWKVDWAAGRNRVIYLFRNGNVIATDQRPPAEETRQSVTTLYRLNAGDQLEIGIGHDVTPSLDADATGDNAPSLALALIAQG